MKPDPRFGKRFSRCPDEKRYFMSQRQMREDRFYQAIMFSRIKRGLIVGAIGVTSGNEPCSCGCGTLATVVYPREEIDYSYPRPSDKGKKKEIFYERGGKIVK